MQKTKKAPCFHKKLFGWKTGFPSNRPRLSQDRLLTLSSYPQEISQNKKTPCFHKKLFGWKTGFPSNRPRLSQDRLLTLSSYPQKISQNKKAPCFHKKLFGWKTGFPSNRPRLSQDRLLTLSSYPQKISQNKKSSLFSQEAFWVEDRVPFKSAAPLSGQASHPLFLSTKNLSKQKKLLVFTRSFLGGRPGSNRRPLEPQSSALTS